MESKLFCIAGHIIKVVLESPWEFKKLTPEQEALVARLAAGEDAGVESVPADRQEQLALNDAIMGKTAMTKKLWETLNQQEKDTSATRWTSFSTPRSRLKAEILFSLSRYTQTRTTTVHAPAGSR